MMLKPKPKYTRRKERNDDLSILTSIQRFRRQPPLQIGSAALQDLQQQRSQYEEDQTSDEQKENLPRSSYERQRLQNREKTFHKSGNVSLANVPSLVTAAETRNILHSHPKNANYKKSQSQNPSISMSHSRSQGIRPVCRNSTSTWAVYSSEVVSRSGPNVLEELRHTAHLSLSSEKSVEEPTPDEFPIWFQNMVKPPSFSDTQSVKSSSTNKTNKSLGKTSLKGCLVQSRWIERNSVYTALTDPKVTVKYSIAELMDIFCGNVPPPAPEAGLFIRPESCPNTNIEENLNIHTNDHKKTTGMNRKHSSKPVRRHLLRELNDTDSSSYFGNNDGKNANGFENETVDRSLAQSIHRRGDRPKRDFFGNLDYGKGQDVFLPSVCKPTNYFDEITNAPHLNRKSSSKSQPRSVLDRENGYRNGSSTKRTNDYFNITSINNKHRSTIISSETGKATPFSLQFNNNINATPIYSEDQTQGFKIPSVPVCKSSTRIGILGVLESNTVQGANFNLPSASATPTRSSIKRPVNQPHSEKRRKKSIRFADFDPIPKSQPIDNDPGSNFLSGRCLGNLSSPFVQQPKLLITDEFTTIGPQFTENSSLQQPSTEMEVSAYEFEARMNEKESNSYGGGLGIIQSNYNSFSLDFEGSQMSNSALNESKWNDYKDPYA